MSSSNHQHSAQSAGHSATHHMSSSRSQGASGKAQCWQFLCYGAQPAWRTRSTGLSAPVSVRSAWPWACSDLPSGFMSGLRSTHFRPLAASSGSGSGWTDCRRRAASTSLLFSRAFRTSEMSLLLATRAAEMGKVFWKKERSSTRIARLTGGRNMASSDMGAGRGRCSGSSGHSRSAAK